jgi:hypothetical protein
MLTTPALNRRSLRWFVLPACTVNPEGQISVTGTARIVRTTFYIALTLLSGRAADRRLLRGTTTPMEIAVGGRLALGGAAGEVLGAMLTGSQPGTAAAGRTTQSFGGCPCRVSIGV